MGTRIIRGDALSGLAEIEDGSVHCVVTSPPYFGLRSYLPDDHPDKAKEIGLEKTPEEYIANLVAVFREVRRVLRKDGVLFVNIADSYNAAGRVGHGTRIGFKQGTNKASANGADVCRPSVASLKEKDLIGIPWLLAFALRADGWYLRGDYIWKKDSCMPESVRDRCTKQHEYVFHLTKSASYFWDQEAIKEPAISGDGRAPHGKGQESIGGRPASGSRGVNVGGTIESRNRRSVWTINPSGFSDAHFATMPPELAEICIKAGSSQKGCCSKCGAPWERETVRHELVHDADVRDGRKDLHGPTYSRHRTKIPGGQSLVGGTNVTTGWTPSCSCDGAEVVPCLVLDPFSGAGTTALVADRLQRNAIGIELHPDYPDMSEKRISGDRGALLDLMEGML